MLKKVIIFLFFISNIHASNIIGTYELKVVIGDHNFIDIFKINSVTEDKINGSFSVPGLFESVFSGKYKKDIIEGHFIAKENNSEFPVSLRATILDHGRKIEGNLSTSAGIFGYFQGIKINQK